jgi:hypothetical protein
VVDDNRQQIDEGRQQTMDDEPRSFPKLPKYQCHKQVRALRIQQIDMWKDGSAILTPEEDGYWPFFVPKAFIDRHNPHAGGFFVVYDDGYKSFSTEDAFIDGYTRIEEND